MIIGSDLNYVTVNVLGSGLLSVQAISEGETGEALLSLSEALSLVDAINWAIKEMRNPRPFVSPVTLEDGKNYKTRSGIETGILTEGEDGAFPFVNADGESWTSGGQWGFYDEETPMDIVSQVV